MFEVTVTVEGLDAVKRRIRASVERFESDLRGAALDAAAHGVAAAQTDHPYQDHREPGKSYEENGAVGLTDTSHAEQLPNELAAEMVWPADYAQFVNKGTSRSAAFPFTPKAVEQAEYALESYVERAVANFKRNAEG